MSTKWFSDKASSMAHEKARQALSQFVADTFPNHELTHFGLQRNFDTNEVVVKLHLNPIGSVRVRPVAPDPVEDESAPPFMKELPKPGLLDRFLLQHH